MAAIVHVAEKTHENVHVRLWLLSWALGMTVSSAGADKVVLQ